MEIAQGASAGWRSLSALIGLDAPLSPEPEIRFSSSFGKMKLHFLPKSFNICPPAQGERSLMIDADLELLSDSERPARLISAQISSQLGSARLTSQARTFSERIDSWHLQQASQPT